MYSDDDPYLTELSQVCLGFPEACEVEAWGRPTFRAGKKIFAVFSGDDDHPYGVIFKPEPDEYPALLQDRRIYVPPYFGAGRWLALDFTARKRIDWIEGRRAHGGLLPPGRPQADAEGAGGAGLIRCRSAPCLWIRPK
jgi:YjbR protein